jgi:hypothetical protein
MRFFSKTHSEEIVIGYVLHNDIYLVVYFIEMTMLEKMSMDIGRQVCKSTKIKDGYRKAGM